MKKYFLILAIILVIAILATGCGGGKPKVETLPTPAPTPAAARQLPGQLRFVSGNRILSTDGIRVEEVARGNYRRPVEYLVEVRGQVVIVQTGQSLLSEGVVANWPTVSPPTGSDGTNTWCVVQHSYADNADVLVCDGAVVFQALAIASPNFSDDGQWLAWAAKTEENGTLDLFIWKVGGREQPIPLTIPGTNTRHQLWPVSGEDALYFASGEGTTWDIFKIVLKSGSRIDEEVGVQRVTAHGNATNPTWYAGALAYQRCEQFNTRAGTLWPECQSGATIWAIYNGVEMKIAEGYDPSWFHPDRQQLPKLVGVMPTPEVTPTPSPTAEVPTTTPTPTSKPTTVPAVPTASPTPPTLRIIVVDWAGGLNLHSEADVSYQEWGRNIIGTIPNGTVLEVLEVGGAPSRWINPNKPDDTRITEVYKVEWNGKKGWIRANATYDQK